MDLGLREKVAMVLGAGGGLGGAVAESLAAEGASLALTDISPGALARTQTTVSRHGVPVHVVPWDLGQVDRVDEIATSVENTLGPIDVLVSITGGPPPTLVSGQASSTWLEHFQSMVLSVIGLTDRLLPGMRQRGWGRIVTATSSGVVTPIPNLGISNTLRISLVGWAKTLAREVGPDGVTVNVVVPGRIATRRVEQLDDARAQRESRPVEEVREDSISGIPLGRYGEPHEFGDVVAFLASDQAAYITGSLVRVDGGMIPSI